MIEPPRDAVLQKQGKRGWPASVRALRATRDLLSAGDGGFADASGLKSGLKVLIPFSSYAGWGAQTTFLRSVANSMSRTASQSRGELILLNLSGESGWRALPKEVSGLVVTVEKRDWQEQRRRQLLLDDLEVGCVLDLFHAPKQDPRVGSVAWIADFQHVHLPGLFSGEEITERNRLFREILDKADRVILSSKDARDDCQGFEPKAIDKLRVHSFPSGLVLDPFPDSPTRAIVEEYHLPEKFALVANQFWTHKNHLLVVEAIRIAASRGTRVPLVMTGLPVDYRDQSNAILSKVLQAIARSGMRDLLIPLAQIPYSHLVALMRTAALVIQPSRFEGWSTIVQDAKALGRPVACSNLGVHREQVPDAIGFFEVDSADELADLLVERWNGLDPGPDLEMESEAIARELKFATDYGFGMWRTCHEAAACARFRFSSASPATPELD